MMTSIVDRNLSVNGSTFSRLRLCVNVLLMTLNMLTSRCFYLVMGVCIFFSMVGNSSACMNSSLPSTHNPQETTTELGLLPEQQLAIACVYGAEDIVSKLLKSGISPNVQLELASGESCALLSYVVQNRISTRILEMLLSSGGNPSDEVVLAAIQGRRIDLLQKLLESGGNPNSEIRQGNERIIAILEAASIGIDDAQDGKTLPGRMVELLIRHGANIHVRTQTGDTVLHIAAMRPGCEHVIPLLVCEGVDINAVNDEGMSPLMIASQFGRDDVCETLISLGADRTLSNKQGLTSIQLREMQTSDDMLKLRDMAMPFTYSEPEATRLLHLSKERLNDIPFGRPILIEAILWNNVPMVRLLLEHGANPNIQSSFYKTRLDRAYEKGKPVSALYHAVYHARSIPIVNLLLKHGAVDSTVDLRDTIYAIQTEDDFNTVLHNWVSVDEIFPCHIKYLVEHVSDLTEVIINQSTKFEEVDYLLLQAVKTRDVSVELIQQLFAKGANPNARDEFGCTPLMYVYPTNTELIHLLLENGADINAQDTEGNTALHHLTDKYLLSEEDSYSNIELLISSGADVSVRNCNGENSLQYGLRLAHTRVMEEFILMSYGKRFKQLSDFIDALRLEQQKFGYLWELMRVYNVAH